MPINIPNALTIFRIVLVPVFLCLLFEDRFGPALAVFVAAGVTDGIDGFIARTFNRKTEFGANLDPFADKLLLGSAYVALTVKGMVPLWLCVPVIFRDAVILSGVLILRGTGRKVAISPTISGKLTTFLQISTVIYSMSFAAWSGGLFTALSIATAAITVYTGFDYALREIRIQRRDEDGR